MLHEAVNLVVGARGGLGSAIVRRLRETGTPVVGLSRPELDLSADLSSWRPPAGVVTAFLCAAATSMRECEERPGPTRAVNVTGAINVAESLLSAGTFVVFLSSDRVFDGKRPRPEADALPCPDTEYGRQKLEVERSLAGRAAAVVRLTKVLRPGLEPFQGWIEALRAGLPIEAYRRTRLAPLPLAAAIDALLETARRRVTGVLQLSGAEDVTYEQAARALAVRLGADPALARGVDRGPDTFASLGCARARAELGFQPPALEAALAALFD